jgi:hypothetical protein
MKLEHLGIAVKSLNESVPVFEKIFGVKASPVQVVEEQKVKVQKIKLDSKTHRKKRRRNSALFFRSG